jgi:predicted transcriptional regulator
MFDGIFRVSVHHLPGALTMAHPKPRSEPRNINQGHWCWMPNLVLDACACGLLDPYAVAVYMALARHANPTNQTCWPSISHMADTLGVTRTTVRRRLKVLRDCGLISVQRRWLGPGQVRYRYTLLAPDARLVDYIQKRIPPQQEEQWEDAP